MIRDAIIIRLPFLPDSFAALLQESEASGYRFLRRVAEEWASGKNRFSGPGEALLGAEIGGILVGVCGLSIDPHLHDPRIGRIRNVYVLAEYRGRNIGRLLVHEAINLARSHFSSLRLRGEESGPARLYESLGFLACSGASSCTHILEFVPNDRREAEVMTDPSIVELLDDLERGYNGDAWHGLPLRKVLDGVTAEAAHARPISGAHSIWAMVAHLAAWDGVVADRIAEQRAIEWPDNGDFPAVNDISPDAWNEAIRELDRQHARLIEAVSALDATRLGETVAGKNYTTAHMLRGVMQHISYHAGQIALLKKLVNGSRTSQPPS
jgi:uncharacterized damage-inducible protein DinB/GNAT superfamily N-acetyltransferase